MQAPTPVDDGNGDVAGFNVALVRDSVDYICVLVYRL